MPVLNNKEIAVLWRKDAMTALTWTKAPNQAGVSPGEAGGYFVEAAGFGRRAYLKPASAHPDARQRCRAAREKIASDLAFDLEILVPPAQLYTLPSPPTGCEEAVAISLVMFPVQWPWSQVRSCTIDATPLGLALAKVLAACSPLIAFDTWLAQTDHGDHPNNIVWGYDPNELADSAIVFLDFAFSMGSDGSWEKGSWKTVARAPVPPLMLQHKAAGALEEIVLKIEQLSEAEIATIVSRIPASHLADGQKQTIIDGLIGRRSLLRDCLKKEGLLQ